MSRTICTYVICLFVALLCATGCKRQSESEGKRGQPDGSVALKNTGQTANEAVAGAVEQNTDEAEYAVKPLNKTVRSVDDFDAGSASDVSLIRLYCDSFAGLDLRRRKLTYHLARGVLAGRDIAFDLLHPNNLEILKLLEAIHQENSASDPNLNAAIARYLRLMWINGGIFDSISRTKIKPDFSFGGLQEAARAANALGAEMGLARDELLEDKLSRLKKIVFDPDYQKLLADPSPHQGRDVLRASHLNLYRGISMRDVAHFDEANPLNSRLVMVGGHPFEEIYRAGDKTRKIAKGRYWRELGRLIVRLQDSMTCAHRAQRLILTDLVEHLRTGGMPAYEQVLRRFVTGKFDVEFYVGFTDTGLDPRGVKGIYQGLVAILDKPTSSKLTSLTRQMQYFEDLMPWDQRYAKHWSSPPSAEAVDLVVFAGRATPVLSSAFHVMSNPDSGQIKVLLFTNVIEAERQAIFSRLAREFVVPAAQSDILAGLPEIAFAQAALREVIGRWLGKTNRRARRKLGANYETLMELKAELVSLWLLPDKEIRELGLLAGGKQARAAYDLNSAVLTLEAVLVRDPQVLDARVLARRIAARYLVEKAKVIGFARKDGKTYAVVEDWRKFREKLASLLDRCEKILAGGSKQAAQRLLTAYSGPPEWKQLDEWTQRAAKAGLNRRRAFVMPKLRPSFDSAHKLIDASLSFDESFDRQMMRYRSY